MEDPRNIVPDQEKGAVSNTEERVDCTDIQEAKRLYAEAKERFVDVNNWQEYTGDSFAAFKLFDETGAPANRIVQERDYFRINIPGPGTVAGDGYDWVQVEKVEEEASSEQDMESVAIRARPAENPQDREHDVAHFFSDDATSSFILRREGKSVIAGVYGRNIVPNTEADNIIDKVRNATVGLGAAAGLSKVQWGGLVKAILGKDE